MLRRTFVSLFLVFAVLLTLGVSAVSGAPPAQEEMTYTVKLGDNLWTLAEKYLGNGAAYHAIVEATNAADGFANIVDPGLIQPGWKLLIPGAEAPAAEAPDVAGQTLVFSSRLFSPPREQEYFINEVIKPFEKEHGVTVNFQILDDDTLFERAGIQQDTDHVTTDIICAHNGKMPDWLDAGWVEDLTPYVESWTDRHFSPTFESDTNRDGKQYFLPVGADVYLLLANNKTLPYLPEGADLDALTWEQYAQWAVNIAEGEGEGKVCITGIPMKSWIYMFGGSALSYGAGFPDANSAEAMEAWKIWETIGKAGGFVPTVMNIDSCVDPMMREESWLTVFHNARAGQVYASNETQFTLAPAPIGSEGIGTIAGVSGYAIMKGAPHHDLAVMFLEYVTRPDIQVKIAKGTGGFIPPVQEALDYMGDEAIDEVISKAVLVLEQGIASGVPGYLYQDWGAVKQCFDDVFEDTILPGNDVDQARLDAAQECVDGLLK
jgi:multiple sugar transport system substrate-binding protein